MMSQHKTVTKAKAIEKIVQKCKNQDLCIDCYFFDGADWGITSNMRPRDWPIDEVREMEHEK